MSFRYFRPGQRGVDRMGHFPAALRGGINIVSLAGDYLYDVLVAVSEDGSDTGAPYANYGELVLGGNSCSTADVLVTTGDMVINGDNPFVASDFFTDTFDRPALWVHRGDLTIASGQTFTPAFRKLMMAVLVTGDVVNNGVVSMSKRGGAHAAIAPFDLPLIAGTHDGVVNPYIKDESGFLAAGTNGGSGCGGRGTSAGTGAGTPARGTCFSGGGGSGASRDALTSTSAAARGGAGGDAGFSAAGGGDFMLFGGGAGNNGGIKAVGPNHAGTITSWQNGFDGTGGSLLWFIRKTLSGNGSFISEGAQGGDAVTSTTGYAGGGSGGGAVTIMAAASTFTGTVSAPGGAGGAGYSSGSPLPAEAGFAGDARLLESIAIADGMLSVAIANSGAELTDHQVRIEEAVLGDNAAFYSDLAGTTPLTFWKASSGLYYVKVPTLAATATTTIYAEIDGAGVSDGEGTFEFFDDFSSGELSTEKWPTQTVPSGGSMTITDGILRLYQPTSATMVLVAASGSFGANRIVEARVRTPLLTLARHRLRVQENVDMGIGETGGVMRTFWAGGFVAAVSDVFVTQLHRFDGSGNFRWEVGDLYSNTRAASTPRSEFYFINGDGGGGVGDTYVDWVLTRKYTANTLTITLAPT